MLYRVARGQHLHHLIVLELARSSTPSLLLLVLDVQNLTLSMISTTIVPSVMVGTIISVFHAIDLGKDVYIGLALATQHGRNGTG